MYNHGRVNMSLVTNYLSPASFDISIAKMPNVEFFVQSVTIPDISSGPAETESALKALYNIPDRLVYADFDVSFIVDENMNNYLEILGWLEGMGSPENRGAQFNAKRAEVSTYYSDITVIVQNSHKNPNLRFIFKNAFPISLGSIELDVKQDTVNYLSCTTTFRYDTFVVERIES